MLTLGERTTWRLIQTGELHAVKVGTQTLVPRTSIEAFLAQGHGNGSSQARGAIGTGAQGYLPQDWSDRDDQQLL